MAAPPPSGAELDLITDESVLKAMWQSEEEPERRHQIRKRMYRLRQETLQEMVQNDAESFGGGCEGGLEVGVVKTVIAEQPKKSQLLKDKLNIESGSEDLVSVNLTAAEETSECSTSSKIHQADQMCTAEEEMLDLERENIIKALQKAGKTVKVLRSEIPIRDGSVSPSMSPSMKRKVMSPKPQSSPHMSPSMKRKALSAKAKNNSRLDDCVSSEFSQLSSYLKDNSINREILVDQGEEEMFDDVGNKVQMVVTTTKDKDKAEFTTRRKAMTTKVVDNVEDIDEILIGNPDHEIIDRDIKEETTKDGHIKIITETRRRPDGVEYTTKNVVKYSKIFDYGHPETIAPCDNDELLETNTETDTDCHGSHIRTETEKRRKCDGTVYINKKSYKVKKVYDVEPSETDEIIDSKQTEEKDEDGNITEMVTQTRKNSAGQEYTLKSRRLTLSAVSVQQGSPTMFNNDEIVDKKEKQGMDDNGIEVTCVTETRARKDGTKYTFDYVTRSVKNFKGSESEMKAMPMRNLGAGNVKVSTEDELIKTETKEDLQEDGSMVRTIIERRKAADGTQYLRHRSMRIPKIPEPKLTVGTVNDEVLQNDVEETEFNGTKIRSITERRRSSLTGLQYTLRRMSKVYHKTRRPSTIPGDEVFDENVTEESGDDGTIIKTIIRRYQRKDGTIYTTHNIHKVFTAPTQVVIEDDGELVDQTMDQSETEDGYIVQTVTETYVRFDGVQYTMERIEQTTKESALYAKDYQQQKVKLIAPSAEDVIVSQDVDETPDEGGLVRRVVTEERTRSDGSKYTTKFTICVTPELVPDQETSYVVIKPEQDMEDTDLTPSMEDKLVYTRKREEVDESGEKVPVVIETRESATTGEKYNVTKRVFSTDVIMTEEGEQVIEKKSKTTDSRTSRNVKSVVTSPAKPAATERRPSPTKTETKPRVTKDVVAEKPKATTTTTRSVRDRPTTRSPKEPSTPTRSASARSTVASKTTAVTESSRTTREKATDRISSVDSRARRTAEVTKSVESTRQSVRKPRTVTETPSPTKTAPRSPAKTPAKSPTKRAVTSRTSSREITPNENKTTPSSTRASTRSRPMSKASPVTNGDKTPLSDARKNLKPTAKTTRPTSSTPTRTEPSRTRPSTILDTPKRTNGTKSPTKTTSNGSTTTDPRVSLPPTPMTDSMKSAPIFTDPLMEPTIEDVTDDPNLPRHKIHRPSVVREPSKDFSEFVDIEKLVDTLDMIVTEDSIVEDTDGVEEKQEQAEDPQDTPVDRKTERRTGSVTDRFRKFDKEKEVKSRKLSLENKDSVSLKRSIFESGNKDVPQDFRTHRSPREPRVDKTPTRAPLSYEGRTPVEEPLMVAKHFQPLGDEDETDAAKSPSEESTNTPIEDSTKPSSSEDSTKPVLDDSTEMSSPKLIMRLNSKDKDTEDNSRMTSSNTSYNGSRRSSSIKEDVEMSFQKEDSPSRFVTGRPIDQGVNTNKIKKIERSLSGKISYDDLEEARKNLPSYLKSIESIYDIVVLDAMLEQAQSYEERRVIRGQVRQAKKRTSVSIPAVSSHSKFIRRPPTMDTPNRSAPNRPSKAAEPSSVSSRRKPSTDTTTKTATATNTVERSTRVDTKVTVDNTDSTETEKTSSSTTRPSRKISADQSVPKSTPASRKVSKDESSPAPLSDTEEPSHTEEPEEVPEEPKSSRRSSLKKEFKRASSNKYIRDDSNKTRNARNALSSRVAKDTEEFSSTKTSMFETSASRKISVENKTSERKTSEAKLNSEEKTISESKVSERRTSVDKTTSSRRSSVDKTTSSRRASIDKKAELDQKNNEIKKTERRASIEKKSTKSFTKRKSEEALQLNATKKLTETPKTSTTNTRNFTPRSMDKTKPADKRSTPVSSNHDEYYVPLRHQKGAPRAKTQAQTDVEKIVSPYGVGVTDENGVPLFGLKALKRKKNVAAASSPAPQSPEKKTFQPTEKSGRPMFGLRAVQKKTAKEVSPTVETKEVVAAVETKEVVAAVETKEVIAAVETKEVSEEVEETVSSTTEATTKRTESVRKRSVTERKTSESSDSSSGSSSGSSSDSSSDEEGETKDVVPTNDSTRRRKSRTEDEVIKRRSQPLKDIIKLHETKVKEEIAPPEEPSQDAPKRTLRSSFSPEDSVSRDVHTWDISSDLASREIDVRNVISKHEIISKDVTSKDSTETETKRAGILKKSSVFSTAESTTSASTVTAGTTVDSTDFMDSMSEAQITRLSEEFDRRTQDDGVISGEYKSSKETSVDRDLATPKRKTSYKEIKLSATKGVDKASRSSQSTVDVNTSTVDVNTSTVDRKRSTVDRKQSTVDVKTSTVDVKTSTVDINTTSVDNKQSTVERKQSTVERKQSTVDVKQSTLDSKQSTLDSKQSTLDSKQTTVDSKRSTGNRKQSTSNRKQSSVDRKQSTVDLKESTVDLKQTTGERKRSTVDRKPSTVDANQSPSIKRKVSRVDISSDDKKTVRTSVVLCQDSLVAKETVSSVNTKVTVESSTDTDTEKTSFTTVTKVVTPSVEDSKKPRKLSKTIVTSKDKDTKSSPGVAKAAPSVEDSTNISNKPVRKTSVVDNKDTVKLDSVKVESADTATIKSKSDQKTTIKSESDQKTTIKSESDQKKTIKSESVWTTIDESESISTKTVESESVKSITVPAKTAKPKSVPSKTAPATNSLTGLVTDRSKKNTTAMSGRNTKTVTQKATGQSSKATATKKTAAKTVKTTSKTSFNQSDVTKKTVSATDKTKSTKTTEALKPKSSKPVATPSKPTKKTTTTTKKTVKESEDAIDDAKNSTRKTSSSRKYSAVEDISNTTDWRNLKISDATDDSAMTVGGALIERDDPVPTEQPKDPKTSENNVSRKANKVADATTYWMTDEYGVKRQVEKDATLNYTVDDYGHRHYTTDSKSVFTTGNTVEDSKCRDIKITTTTDDKIGTSTDGTTYWMTDEYGVRRQVEKDAKLPTYTVDSHGRRKYSTDNSSRSDVESTTKTSKDTKSSYGKVTADDKKDDGATYWMTDEYGIKRQVEKDSTATFTVDDYGHSHFVSDATTKYENTTKTTDSSKVDVTKKVDETADSTMRWVTDDNGVRQEVKVDRKRSVDRYGRDSSAPASRKNSKTSSKVDTTKTDAKSVEIKVTKTEDEKVDKSADDGSTYWMLDEYGIKRQVKKDEMLPSYTVDKYGHPHCAADSDSKTETKSTTETLSKVNKSSDVESKKTAKDTVKNTKGDGTTYWMTDEYGIKRQVEKDSTATFTVDDDYGHSHYVTDATTKSENTTKTTDSSKVDVTKKVDETTDSSTRWITDDNGVRQEVKVDRKRSVDRYGRENSAPASRKNSKTSSKFDTVKTDAKSVDIRVTKTEDEKVDTSTDDGTTYWMTDEYGIKRQVKKDEKLPSYTVDKYGHPHYVVDSDYKTDTNSTTKTVSKVNKSSDVKSTKTTKDSVKNSKDDGTTYWMTDEYGIKRQVEKDSTATFTVDDYGHSHYVSDATSKSENTTKTKESTKVDVTKKVDETADSSMRWITDDNGVRQEVKVDRKRSVDRYGRDNSAPAPRKNSKTSPKVDKTKAVANSVDIKVTRTEDEKVEKSADDRTTYWMTDEYGIKRQVEKDSTATFTVDDYGHSHYVSDAASKSGETTKTKDSSKVDVTMKVDDTADSSTRWITDDNGVRQEVKVDRKRSVDRYGQDNPAPASRKNSTGKPVTPTKTKLTTDGITKKDDKTTYWMTDEYGVKRQVEKDSTASYTVDDFGRRHYASDSTCSSKLDTTKTDAKSVDINVTRTEDQKVDKSADDRTTYWMTDEYGIKRQVEKDTTATFTVDDYGHSHYVSDVTTKSENITKNKDSSKVDVTKKVDETADSTMRWITDDNGVRQEVKIDRKRSVDRYGRDNPAPASRKNSKNSSKIDTAKTDTRSVDFKATKTEIEKVDMSADDGTTYWTTDEYGIKRQVNKDEKLPSYTVDKYGHPHYVDDSATKTDTDSKTRKISTDKKTSDVKVTKTTDEKVEDGTTFWMTDEYGIKRQVEKDSRLNYTVDKYGHRQYISDSTTKSEKITKDVDTSKIETTSTKEEGGEGTMCWITDDKGVRRQVERNIKRGTDKRGRPSPVSKPMTNGKSKSPGKSPSPSTNGKPSKDADGTTYWMTDEYGIKRQVEKDSTATFTVDDYGHSHYVSDSTSKLTVDKTEKDTKSVDIKVTKEVDEKVDTSTTDDRTYWMTDEYGVRRQVKKDVKLPTYTVDKYGRKQYITDETSKTDCKSTSKTTTKDRGSSDVSIKTTADKTDATKDDGTTYWITDEYGVRRQVEKDAKLNYTVDKYGRRHYIDETNTNSDVKSTSKDTSNVRKTSNTNVTNSTNTTKDDKLTYWTTDEYGIRRQVEKDEELPTYTVNQYGHPQYGTDSTSKPDTKPTTKTSPCTGPKTSNAADPLKDDGITYWIVDEYGVKRQVKKDAVLNYTVDEFGHRHYVTDSKIKTTRSKNETERKSTDIINTNENKDDMCWITDDNGVRREVKREKKHSVDRHSRRNNVPTSKSPGKPKETTGSPKRNDTPADNDDGTTYWMTDEYGIKRQVQRDSTRNYTVDDYGHSHYINESNSTEKSPNDSRTRVTNTVDETTNTSTDEGRTYWMTDEYGVRRQVKKDVKLPTYTVDKYGRKHYTTDSTTTKCDERKTSDTNVTRTTKDSADISKDDGTTYWITDEYGVKRQVQKDSSLNYTVDKYGHRHYITDSSTESNTKSTTNVKSSDIKITTESEDRLDSSYCWVTDFNGVRKQVKRETKRPVTPVTKKPILKKEVNSDNQYWMTDSYGNRKLISASEKPKKLNKSYLSNTESSKNKSVTIKVEEDNVQVAPEPYHDGPSIWITDREGVRRRVPKPEGRRPKSTRHHHTNPQKDVKINVQNIDQTIDDDMMSEYSFVSESDSSFFFATDSEGLEQKITRNLVEDANLDDLAEFDDSSTVRHTINEERSRSRNEQKSSDQYEIAYFLHAPGGDRVQVSKYEYEKVMGEG